jgi:hydrogenase maturation protease
VNRGGACQPDESAAAAGEASSMGGTPRVRVIGVGQMSAGDDGVGLAVLEWLRASRPRPWIELAVARDDSALIDRLQSDIPIVIVDAVLQDPPGRVCVLRPDDLRGRRMSLLSTHGIGVGQALALGRLLTPEAPLPEVRIVAVTIARPQRYEQLLSAAVAAAVPVAGRRVLAICRRLAPARRNP